MPQYAELLTTTNFSFLEGASHPEEYIQTAKQLGYKALAVSDKNSLAGVVRAHLAAKRCGLPFVVGCRLRISYQDLLFETGAYPCDREAYGRLCSLLSRCRQKASKNKCALPLLDLAPNLKNMALLVLPPSRLAASPSLSTAFESLCTTLKESVDKDMLSIAICKGYQNGEAAHVKAAINSATHLNLPLAASNDVYCHIPTRRPLLDVITCIRRGCTLAQAGRLLFQNMERYLKPPQEMARLFKEMPHALHRTLEIAEAGLGFSLDQLRYEYPSAISPPGCTPWEHLRSLTLCGAAKRYPNGIPLKVQSLIAQELKLIKELSYEKYFLTCYDLVRFAESRGILCQGRGSAANSVVCYCLGITAVDPTQIDLLFARFISKERGEPPDIDIDFEHERREEVIQYIYQKFGREHAALTAEVITYRPRSAIRDIGKVLALAPQVIDRFAKSAHHWNGYQIPEQALKEAGLHLSHPLTKNLLNLTQELSGFPRHLSQHAGGFIICERPISECVPILKAAMPHRTIIEWNKDDIEALGILKIDVLGLGMLSCIRRALNLINPRRQSEGLPPLALHTIPREDARVYDMICAADTVGVFQIESRAQMSMLPRLKPRCFYDLVIEVAIVRPGPIQGNMVHPYLRRRNGEEPIEYPDQRARDILGKTLGIPLFQEQALRLAIALAGFSPGEAEQLRRAMAAWRRNKDLVSKFRERVFSGMIQNGYTPAFIENCLKQLQGFSEYGFPESHAASFALLVYASAWIKRYYPAEFGTALLNSQPMGFYAPAQIIRDCQRHGVRVLPIDVNYSHRECSVEKSKSRTGQPFCLRLGLGLIKGMPLKEADALATLVAESGPFASIEELWRVGYKSISLSSLYKLAEGNAFRSMKISRREAFWQIRALPIKPSPLMPSTPRHKQDLSVRLPSESAQLSVFNDYRSTGFSLKAHPIYFLRTTLNAQNVSRIETLKKQQSPNLFVAIAGLVLFRQRPSTSKGVVFITLEDETGQANLIVRPDIFEKYQDEIVRAEALIALGKVQYIGRLVYLEVMKLKELTLKN